MEQNELYIHYGAPSLVRDDERWRKLAHSIADFQATSKCALNDESSSKARFPCSGSRMSEIVISTKPLSDAMTTSRSSFNDRSSDKISNQRLVTNTRRTQIDPPKSVERETKRVKYTSTRRMKQLPDTVSQTPVTHMFKASRVISRATPVLKKRQLTFDSIVLVPQTDSKPKQVDRNLIGPTSSKMIEDSGTPERVDETLFDLDSSDSERSLLARSVGTTASPTAVNLTPGVRIPTAASLRKSVSRKNATCSNTEFLFTTMDAVELEQNVSTGRSYPEGHTISEFQGSTMPSRCRISRTILGNSCRAISIIDGHSEEYMQPSGHSSEIEDTSSSTPQISRRDVFGPVSSPQAKKSFVVHSQDIITPQTIYDRLSRLPQKLQLHVQVGNVSQANVFSSDVLHKLAVEYKLESRFRPSFIAQRMHGAERGDWRLLIHVLPTLRVEMERHTPISDSQKSDRRFILQQEGYIPPWASTAEGEAMISLQAHDEVPANTYTPWTIDEFTDFWSCLKKCLNRGRLGRFVRAIITEKEEDLEGVRMQVRVFSSVSIMPHLWLVMLGLSNGLIERMPLRWFSARKGLLIQMTGRKHGGRAGTWVELGAGYWGSNTSTRSE